MQSNFYKWGNRIAYKLMLILGIVFSLTMGIIGIIAEKNYGAYPDTRFIDNIREDGLHSAMSNVWSKEAYKFLEDSSIMEIIGIITVVIICWNIIRVFYQSISKGVTICVCGLLFVLGGIFLNNDAIQIASFSHQQNNNLTVFLFVLIPLIIAIICMKKSGTLKYFASSFIPMLFHLTIVPIVMWFCRVGAAEAIKSIIGGILLVGIALVVIPASLSATGGSYAAGGSCESNIRAKEVKKTVAEIDHLKNTNKECREGVNKKLQNKFGYGHVDVKAENRRIAEREREILQNEKKLAELVGGKKS